MSTTSEQETPVVGQLEDEAKKRKERLQALRNKLQVQEPSDGVKSARVKGAELPSPHFRSYNPQTPALQEAAPASAAPISIEPQISDTLEQGKIQSLLDDVELVNLAPRKPDWDLKRDVAGKLEKLERRTQRAIAELIIDRLKREEVPLVQEK